MIIRIQKSKQALQSVQSDLIGKVVGDDLCMWHPLRIDAQGACLAFDHRRIVRVIGRQQWPIAVCSELAAHVKPRRNDRLAQQLSFYRNVGAVEYGENGRCARLYDVRVSRSLLGSMSREISPGVLSFPRPALQLQMRYELGGKSSRDTTHDSELVRFDAGI